MDDRFAISETGELGGIVTCRNSQGSDLQGMILKLERHRIVFETYSPSVVLRTSEVLSDFTFRISDTEMYSGSAVVATVLHTGTVMICEANLSDSWVEADLFAPATLQKRMTVGFDQFVRQWQKVYKLNPEYKAIIGNIQTFLIDLRLWLERLELGIRGSPAEDRIELELEIARTLRPQVTGTMTQMFERFEAICDDIEEDAQPAHRVFGQRQLHPHLLSAPFIYRTYIKPLGYAGDYEMMNMIIRNGYEGASLYAKLVNAWLLDQDGPEAVRNRVGFLTNKLIEETSRVSRAGKIANIFCVACGPAWEVVNFMAEQLLADQARFDLLDFNEETLQYTGGKIDETRKKHGRKTEVKLIKNSVQNLLRSGARGVAKYDLIYCSGLYDYLNDRICKALNNYFYDLLLPGGLLVVGNFGPHTPVKHFIEHFLEWFLIYRDPKQLATFTPEQARPDNCSVVAEGTGSNLFFAARKDG